MLQVFKLVVVGIVYMISQHAIIMTYLFILFNIKLEKKSRESLYLWLIKPIQCNFINNGLMEKHSIL